MRFMLSIVDRNYMFYKKARFESTIRVHEHYNFYTLVLDKFENLSCYTVNSIFFMQSFYKSRFCSHPFYTRLFTFVSSFSGLKSHEQVVFEILVLI